MVNEVFSLERGLQIVVALSRFLQNVVPFFFNDRGKKLLELTKLAFRHKPRETPEAQHRCHSHAHCQTYSHLNTYLGRQGVIWFPHPRALDSKT